MSHEPGALRSPARFGALLVPIWGYRFVSQFLEFGLPTLLAPGNLPSVARELPFRVVALTSEEDEPLLLAHPAWRRLQKICAADIERIDDLITESNHSATMTLALARAIRSCGAEMVDTCFVLWMSDYLSANGSLAAVMRGFRNGASGIFAGNFQIVAEDAAPSLRRSIDLQSSVISVSNRELLTWSLDYLHPATMANFVNAGLSHNSYTDRLFWRVDEETLIGRYYLMHPIGVRPESVDFEIGSSFDYSFIPEMCPSGRILTLIDSDEYFIVEMQKRDHDHQNLIPGPLDKSALAAQLSEWTTAQHRENAIQTVVFHAGDVPANLGDVAAEADRYVAEIGQLLSPQPQPHRGHHYWVGSIAVNRARSGRALSQEDWKFLAGESPARSGLAGLPSWLRRKTFGAVPEVTRLHPRWPDYQVLLGILGAANDQRLLLVAEEPRIFLHWLVNTRSDAATIGIERLLNASPAKYWSLFEPLAEEFGACVVLLPEARFHQAGELLARLAPLLAAGGKISVVAMNERPTAEARGFLQNFARHSSRLIDLSLWVADAQYVPASRLRWSTYQAFKGFSERSGRSRLDLFILLGRSLCVGPLALLNYLTSGAVKPIGSPPPLSSSIVVQLRHSSRQAHAIWTRSSGPRIGNPTVASNPIAVARGHAVAPRDDCHVDLVAKYGFVSGLLDRRADVAGYGSIDSLGSKMILEKVKKLSVYDPDPSRISQISQKIFDPWKFYTRVHDPLDMPLPVVHDAIYNLDTLEYISPSDEDRYVGNLSRSLLRRQDILIIGLAPCGAEDEVAVNTPPTSSPTRLDLATGHRLSKADDIGLSPGGPGRRVRYRRTSVGVKALLEGHFRTVSLFSMTAGVIQAGAGEAADYLFALCSSKKN